LVWLVKSKLDAKNAGSLNATVCTTRAEHFYRIGDDDVTAPSILPINRAQTLNRDGEQSADFVELLDLAGLGQVGVRSITPADLDLEAGRFGCEVFLAGMPLRLKSEAPTVQVDARSRSATTPNKCRGHAQFHGHLQLKPLKESDRLEK
jgi:hypothetical protein